MAETDTGEFRDGVVVCDDGTPPSPEGARLRVELIKETPERRGRTLADRLAPIIGIAEGLPADMAERHDHDIHGTPRREEK